MAAPADYYPAPLLFANAPENDRAQVLREHELDPEQWTEYVSPYTGLLVDTRRQRVLVDTGAGGMAPTTGNLIPNLQAVGIAPEEIDTVILTHGHTDQIGGSIDDDGQPALPLPLPGQRGAKGRGVAVAAHRDRAGLSLGR